MHDFVKALQAVDKTFIERRNSSGPYISDGSITREQFDAIVAEINRLQAACYTSITRP